MTHPDTQRLIARVEELTGCPVAVETGSGFYEQAQMMSARPGAPVHLIRGEAAKALFDPNHPR